MTEDLLRRAQMAEKFASLSQGFNPYVKQLYELRSEVIPGSTGATRGLLHNEFKQAELAVREIQHSLNRLTTWALTGRLDGGDEDVGGY